MATGFPRVLCGIPLAALSIAWSGGVVALKLARAGVVAMPDAAIL
jgi:hypothetical protein